MLVFQVFSFYSDSQTDDKGEDETHQLSMMSLNVDYPTRKINLSTLQ